MVNVFQQHGAFSWSELMTTDVSAAKEFYGKVFGWGMEDGPVNGVDYTVLKAGDQSMGGIMQMPPDMQGMPPSWGAYVTVDDVDASTQLVQELGGKVLVPATDIPGVGKFALIQDPQGAVLSVITYSAPS